jgi:hypothetical protein
MATLDEVKALKPTLLGMLERQGIKGSVGIRLGDTDVFSLSVHLQTPLPAGTTLPDKVEGIPVHYRFIGEVRLL